MTAIEAEDIAKEVRGSEYENPTITYQPTQGEIDTGTDHDEIICGCEEGNDCE